MGPQESDSRSSRYCSYRLLYRGRESAKGPFSGSKLVWVRVNPNPEHVQSKPYTLNSNLRSLNPRRPKTPSPESKILNSNIRIVNLKPPSGVTSSPASLTQGDGPLRVLGSTYWGLRGTGGVHIGIGFRFRVPLQGYLWGLRYGDYIEILIGIHSPPSFRHQHQHVKDLQDRMPIP